MAENKRITRNPAEHLEHLRICWNKNENPETPAEYKFPDREKDNLEDAYKAVRMRYDQWKTRSYKYSELTAKWAVMSKDALDFIGRVRSFWRARFGEGNTYEITAGIDGKPRRKTLLYMALHDICTVSNDNPGSDITLPASLRDACWSLYEDMRNNVDATQEALMDKNDSYEELKIAITEKGLLALRACREILYMILPQGKRDSMIIAWGFDPWDYPVHHKPADQKLTDTSYDPETDIAIIRGTEDPTADEYILEYAMTQSPAVAGSAEGSPTEWTPAEWEVFMTSDEPYFETEALREGFTYAFRMRARNGAGYGGYSDVWVVEVV